MKLKRGLVVIVALIMFVLTFSACGDNEVGNDANVTKENTINFDLSQYTSYGELSCGRIWVKRIVGDWDQEKQEQFAYLDSNGNAISPWFSSDKYESPRNFANGYVVLVENKRLGNPNNYSNCIVYNTYFKKVASLICKKGTMEKGYITDFDEQGYAYALGYDETIDDSALYWIDSAGAHKFYALNRDSDTVINRSALECFYVSNNYFVLVASNAEYMYTEIACIYDASGKFVFSIEDAMRNYIEEFAITKTEVLGSDRVKFNFCGLDREEYVCTMDFNGNFVEEPVLVGGETQKTNKTEWSVEQNDQGIPSALRIGITNFPPLNYENDDGELVGFDTELAQLVCGELNIAPVFIYIPDWQYKIEELNSENIDCIWNGLVYTEELAKKTSVTDTYFQAEYIDEFGKHKEDYVVAFRKEFQHIEKFNKELNKLKEDGTIAKLAEKYGMNNIIDVSLLP